MHKKACACLADGRRKRLHALRERPSLARHTQRPAIRPTMEAKAVFESRRLKGKLLGALQAARSDRGEAAVKDPVMNAEDLRAALLETLGDEVPSKDLFPLMQLADPESDGVVTMSKFVEVVELRKAQVETQRRQALLTKAYQALGGTVDRDVSIKSDTLVAISTDFLGSATTSVGMAGVLKHRRKAVEELLGMGGALDSDDEEEMKDTSKMSFEELEAFGMALRERGSSIREQDRSQEADEAQADGEGGGPSSVLR